MSYGRIYKLISNIDNRYYIGSTKLSLQQRLQAHISACNNSVTKNRRVYKWIRNVKPDNITMILIVDDINCVDLRREENKHIDINDDNCMNSIRASTS